MVSSDPGSKADLLIQISTERAALDAVLDRLTPAQMQHPGLEGGRSAKDVLAHIMGWEQKMIQWIRESYAGLVPDRPAPGEDWENLDGVNQALFSRHRETPLPAVAAEASTSYQDALEMVRSMGEADLFDGDRFAWRKGDPMWHMVAANTFWHYREHREQIERAAAIAGSPS